MNDGWILLHKKFLDWEWYSDHNACRLFIHLLLKANYEDRKWRGVLIKRGERATSLRNLAKETGLTLKQIRLSLDKLKRAQQTAQRTAHKGAQSFSIITICNYEEYQQGGAHSRAQRTAQRRATNKRNKEEKNNYIGVFEFWNEQGICKHKAFTATMESKLKGALKNYSVADIKIAIEKYRKVYKGDEYFFSYKWTFEEFLTRPNGLTGFFSKDCSDYLKREDSQKPQTKIKLDDGTTMNF